MNSPKYCLDTHPLIWYLTGQKALSSKAKQIIDGIFKQKIDCFISSIVLLEAFHISLKHKNFNFTIFLKSLRLSNIIIVPLDKVILTACFHLPKQLDIHDRVICATAKINKTILVTKDPELHNILSLETFW